MARNKRVADKRGSKAEVTGHVKITKKEVK